ncbi:hypothetical protein SAMN05660649_00405 [Desulfotomaculum arcticum]|uniref:Uncharacterized protein n=1 Tax=Desulfotruncus arcticus DSM 17038 TaxID=1121424 RepID=A0A1I2N8D3_9FIRM|nr:hypothetical protein [Desulfotruncus arcticus]SFF99738.1 hypothetical protein SAMN05660649_00405 [Desulfotomaculum arcticum] [Desulfotruncus arcticus DSM 17038]
MSSIMEPEELEKVLRELYHAQKCTFFLEDAMGKVIDNLGLSEQQAIDITKLLIEKKLITTNSFLPATFLRPKYIRMFPVVLSTKAITMMKESDN